MSTLRQQIQKDDQKFKADNKSSFKMPVYNPKKHYRHLTNQLYFKALLTLRHYIKIASDDYFGNKLNAKNVDLFMFTPSVSSPTGSGSNSEPIRIKFGKLETNLVDSSQFGFEPLLLNGFDKVYCYLPSMRGEDSDNRHLNQFFHCEMEMIGDLNRLVPLIEGYVKILCKTILSMKNIVEKISENPQATKQYLEVTIKAKMYPKITFDEAVEILIKNNKKDCINFTKKGRDITSRGELELMKILKLKMPIWIMYYDRDRVPFYQKPKKDEPNKTINADLLFPAILKNSFGGEIIGCGQRQDKSGEMYKSLKRQNNISPVPYEWYIDLRRKNNYQTTSGFGLGVERFIAWSLGKSNIRDVIPYPRLKNIKTYP